MHFVAVDVETANADMASICQIGIAEFSQGSLINEWSTLVDPEDYFDAVNISIHGITESAVKGQPTLSAIASELRTHIEGKTCVCHTHFDRVSISRAFQKYQFELPSVSWLDSARVARRTWKEFARKGYGLTSICEKIGYQFKSHDALEDAKAAGYVLLAAIEQSQLDLDAWKHRVTQPIDLGGSSVQRDGNPDGHLYGEVIVFTGALQMRRSEAADMAANIGCQVAPSVTKSTTILAVGDQDVSKLAGREKSAKHRKAEQLVSEGQAIRIVRESDFRLLVSEV